MKKLITTLVLLLSLVSIQAQTVKELSLKVDSLQLKLDKLQHDYDFLYCECKLNKVKADVDIFRNELKIMTNSIDINIINNNTKAYTITKMTYEECLKNYENHKRLYQANVFLISTKLENSNLNEIELNVLKNIAESIEYSLEYIGKILQNQKDMLDVYRNIR